MEALVVEGVYVGGGSLRGGSRVDCEDVEEVVISEEASETSRRGVLSRSWMSTGAIVQLERDGLVAMVVEYA